jgi:Lipopolysaccharide-assembly
LGFLVTGCAGYKLGPTNGTQAGSRSVQIELFRNETFEPQLSDALATALRRSIQRDGTYLLATRGGADVRVEGVLDQYHRLGVSYQPSDILTIRDYELTIRAKVKATDTATGKVLLDQHVSGRTLLRPGKDLTAAERQAGPLLAEDLARNITGLLVDGNW